MVGPAKSHAFGRYSFTASVLAAGALRPLRDPAALEPDDETAGPGRPTDMKNKRRAREHPVGKQDKPNLAAVITSSRAA